MILIIDNYDSFTYNLVQLVGQSSKFIVARNDQLNFHDINQVRPSGIVISPGPGRPEDAGVCVDLIRIIGRTIPILGVCLGHQAIGYAFGGEIAHAPSLMHGKTSLIYHNNDRLFRNLPNPFEATRYHSLVVSHTNLPQEFSITARTDDNVIMGIRHNQFPLDGIQFHPESILTTVGPQIIINWLSSLQKQP